MSTNNTKSALSLVSSGLYVLTTQDNGQVGAATVSWLSQISFKPRLVMVALRKGSRIYELVRSSGRFVINILGQHQQDAVTYFLEIAK
ncbi:MAG: flavin reductase family protein [Planctomycetes bacterium]|nr:flavin reductase family protein [Planctomycetota bacterium]